MEHAGPIGALDGVLGQRGRAVVPAERQCRLGGGRAPGAEAELLDDPLRVLTGGQRRLERLLRAPLGEPQLGHRVHPQRILEVEHVVERQIVLEHGLGAVELAALDQAQRQVRGGRALELVPSVAARVARLLDVGERLVDPSLPQAGQATHQAGGGEVERRAASTGVVDRRAGDVLGALERSREAEGAAGDPPADPLRGSLLEQQAAVPGPFGQLEDDVGVLAGERGPQRSVGEHEPLALGARDLGGAAHQLRRCARARGPAVR